MLMLVAALAMVNLFAQSDLCSEEQWADPGSSVPEVAARAGVGSWEGTGLPESAGRALALVGDFGDEWPHRSVGYEAHRSPVPGAGGILEAMFGSPDPAQRIRALEAWFGAGASEAVSKALDALADPSPEVRGSSVRLLAGSSRDGLAESLLDAVSHGESEGLNTIATALGSLKGPLEAPMLHVLSQGDELVARRVAAAWCLGHMGCRSAREALAAEVWSEDLALSMMCAEALYALRDPQAVVHWAAFLKHPNPDIRVIAVEGLGIAGTARAFDALRRLAFGEFTEDAVLEGLAVQGMGLWPLRESAESLVGAMRENPRVRATAGNVLRVVTGESLGDDAGAWEAWLTRPARQGGAEGEARRGRGPQGRLPFDVEYMER